MPTGFQLPDGRDFESVFTAGNGNQTTGFQLPDSADLGNRFIAGNSGITTRLQLADGRDLGQVLGTYAPMSLHYSNYSRRGQSAGEEYDYWAGCSFSFVGGTGPYRASLKGTTQGGTWTNTINFPAAGAHQMETKIVSWGAYAIDCELTITDATNATIRHTGRIA